MTTATRPGDAGKSWVDRAPEDVQGYLRLGRYDRPIGFWLLAIPCWAGLALSRIGTGFVAEDIAFFILYGLGAIAMRGAGCTYNDILDKDIDKGVARTAGRPLPSGQVSLRNAWAWLFFQVGIGFLVWLALPMAAKLVALGAIPLVAAYPLMKRITWWPQAWLGLTFNYGILIASVAAGGFGIAPVLLYLGFIAWTIGYDTIYALQDVEDDALIGVRSTARLFGERFVEGVAVFYIVAIAGVSLAALMSGGGHWVTLTAIGFLAHLSVQLFFVWRRNPSPALALFKSNRSAGLIVVGGFAIAAILS